MTSERRVLVGFNDVRAVVLECKACQSRLSLTAATAATTNVATCPSCGHAWLSATRISGSFAAQPSGRFLAIFADLVREVMSVDAATAPGVRVLLEIDEPH
jgi:hypothetical protein